jgi:hypothetical protein
MPKENLLYDEPPKKKTKKDKKKKLKQKQKQKQIVKTNVKVNVQSSGGAGAGTSGYVPYQFQDRTGENMRIQNLIDTLQKQTSRPPVVPPVVQEARPPVIQGPAVIPRPQRRAPSPPKFKAPFIPSFTAPSEYFFSASEMEGDPVRVRIPRRPDTSNLSLYERVDLGNRRADSEMNFIQEAQNERQSALSLGDYASAYEIGESIDDADDRLGVINNSIQNDVESRTEAKPKRKYRTKEEIARDEALKPPKQPVGRPPKGKKSSFEI